MIGLPLFARGGGAAVFDPATLSLTAWLKKNYTGSPWVGNASAGTSANQNATEATTPPTASSGDADFDGTDDILLCDDTLDTYFNAGAWSIAILFNGDTTIAAGADATEDEDLFSDGAGTFFAVGYSNDGVRTTVFSGGYVTLPVIAQATGSWCLYQAKGNGTNMYHRINSTAWSAGTACGNIGGLTNQPYLGQNYSTKRFDGKMREFITSDTVLSDTNFDDYKSYINATYGLSL